MHLRNVFLNFPGIVDTRRYRFLVCRMIELEISFLPNPKSQTCGKIGLVHVLALGHRLLLGFMLQACVKNSKQFLVSFEMSKIITF